MSHGLKRCLILNLLMAVLAHSGWAAGPADTPPDAAVNTLPAAAASTVYAEAMAQGNLFYEQREASGAIEKAIDAYKAALATNPEDYAALWRLSRSYWWHGDHAPQSEKGQIFDLGKSTAERAQKAAPDKSEGHYWFGVNLGRASEVRGILNSLFAVDPIRKSMEKVLEIDPKDGFAFHVLGVLYRKAPGWPLSCGDINKSLENAKKAVTFAPEDVLPRIGLAETLKAQGKKDEAVQLLQEALSLPGAADKQPETRKDKQTAQSLLDQWK